MTKADLIKKVASEAEMTKKDAEELIDSIFDSIVSTLDKGEKIELRGFGSFRVRQRTTRRGRDPKTGASAKVFARAVSKSKHHYLAIDNVVDKEIENKFNRLAEEWYRETLYSSAYLDKIMHPSYQQIIGLGKKVIPFILNELRDEPAEWFWALRALTGEDPTTSEQAGKRDEMAKAWLNWGEENNIKWLPLSENFLNKAPVRESKDTLRT
jgi:nucleoid DNA-binding protein